MNNEITLENYYNNLITDTEVIDYIENKLIEQNAQSADDFDVGPRCVYRSNTGLKCAVGHLISDEQYHNSMENKPFDKDFLCEYYPELYDNIYKTDNMHKTDVLVWLQAIHDRANSPKTFIKDIKEGFKEVRQYLT